MMDPGMETSYGVYVHFPFCVRRCRYCDFFSTEKKWNQVEPYLHELLREIASVGEAGRRPSVDSVYFGGGTPSLMSPEQAKDLLSALADSFHLSAGAEISLESNPRTVDWEKLAGFRSAGVNRLSLGMQSGEDDELQLLGRIHRFADTRQAYEDARKSGFENISLDLIFGLPGQTLPAWERSLSRALSLEPEHISLYALTLERGTELAQRVRCGELPEPEEDASADMYERTCVVLARAGYRQYEISNWARDGGPSGGEEFPGFACRHNLRYWQNQPYLGLGAGAHGCAAGKRYANIRSVDKYIRRMKAARPRRFPLSSATVTSRIRTREDEMRETMWLGLRLTEAGVSRREFLDRFGVDFNKVFDTAGKDSVREGLLEWDGDDRLRLSTTGRLLGNRVFSRFV
jgi:oxygen-independent coproporphyrinogen-3 oxidase